MKAFLFAQADRFLPPGGLDPDEVRQLRAAVVQSWLGIFFTSVFGLLYAVLGSPISGASISLILAGVIAVPWLIRRGVSVFWISHAVVGTTWLSTFIVVGRSGGFSSPALVWAFLLPLVTYSVCGKRSALAWAWLGSVQIAVFFVCRLVGVEFPQDFSPGVLEVLRISGYSGVILAVISVLLVLESVRSAAIEVQRKAERALERQRILDDMHDGVGSQLLGLLVRARKGGLGSAELQNDLETCLGDLRLIVDSLDPQTDSPVAALGGVRARIDAKSRALGIDNEWSVDEAVLETLTPAQQLQIFRALSEMVVNAQRHSGTSRIEIVLCFRAQGERVLEVRDHGRGFELGACSGVGRGLKSLKTRADRLGGRLDVSPAEPGARVALFF